MPFTISIPITYIFTPEVIDMISQRPGYLDSLTILIVSRNHFLYNIYKWKMQNRWIGEELKLCDIDDGIIRFNIKIFIRGREEQDQFADQTTPSDSVRYQLLHD